MRRTTDVQPLVAFDFDGTLVHSPSDSSPAVEDVLRQHGVECDAPGIREAIDAATSDRALVAACVDKRLRTDAYRSIVRLHLSRASALRLLPGVADMLADLRQRYILAIYTGRDEYSLRAALEALGIAEFFAHVEGDTGAYPPKPNPAALLSIASRARLSADRCAYVGDRVTDSASAAAAGYHFVAAVWRKDVGSPGTELEFAL